MVSALADLEPWRKLMDAVPNEDGRWQIFNSAVEQFASLVGRDIDRLEAVDRLQSLVDYYALDTAHAQMLMADAFHDVTETQPGDYLQSLVEADRTLLDEERKPQTKPNGHDEAAPLPYVDLTADLVERAWLIADCIPMANVSLLSGDGAVGKSIALLQLAAAVVLGKYWFDLDIKQAGPVLYIAAEDDEDEIRRRLEAIAKHFQSTRAELQSQGLRLLSYAGRDATLAQPDKVGVMVATPLLAQILFDAMELKPKLIVLDTVADCFAGHENDRTQTRQFITMLRGIAIAAGAALIMASHPSLAGKRDDTGLSGSTAWHNSVRARLYFKSVTEPDEPDTGQRILEIRKNNYGPVAKSIRVFWRDGVFVTPKTKTDFEREAENQRADRIFLHLLEETVRQGRNVSDRPSVTYAPAVFAELEEAKAAKLHKRELLASMERLFKVGRIVVRTEGPPSKQRRHVAVASNGATDGLI